MMTKRLHKRSIFKKGGFKTLILLLFLISFSSILNAQHSVARQWSELMLTGIRNDFARPTVHSRNLFHVSAGMYDAWAVYDADAKPYMLGDSVGGFSIPFTGVPSPSNIDSARIEAISFAAYRLLRHRFQSSPGAANVMPLFDTLMVSLNFDTTNTSVNYALGDPAALGNYIAQQIIAFGLQDGANEQNDYINQYYTPVNPPLAATVPGNPDIVDPDRWQPLSLDVFIDQSGNLIPYNTPEFLGPEWGAVTPFSLNDSMRNVYTRDGDDYVVYHDPSDPPYLDTVNPSSLIEEYQWGFSLVSVWSSHLDSANGVLWDISPASIGNVQSYPTNVPDLQNFYNLTDGGDPGIGHAVNPSTGLPYAPQIVPRADYARVLAEFWADGPDSETPPGHWFELLNHVNDDPDLVKKWRGQGDVLDDLEWDVKAYFTMGGTVHDAAVTSWGIKGWYDYLRPISAIRHMADNGQSSDSLLPNYAINGIPLLAGYIELVVPADTLQGFNAIDTGKIKVFAWRGPDYIADPEVDDAGVGWILAENWWPYQRPTFITPPFGGYVSGHSTFSRAAAEVMTAMTGDPFFPGGMGEFVAVKDSFLVFEEGPSVDITLQWATYRDASDQCSLSRIWGGIHPPADDIPGRLMGEKIGVRAFGFAESYMNSRQPSVISISASVDTISLSDVGVSTFTLTSVFSKVMDTLISPTFTFPNEDPLNTIALNMLASSWLNDTTFVAIYDVSNSSEIVTNINVDINGASDSMGIAQILFQGTNIFSIDTKSPNVLQLFASIDTISTADVGVSTFTLTAVFDEVMDTLISPTFTFPNENPSNTISLNVSASNWLNDTTFFANYDVITSSELVEDINVNVNGAVDRIGNPQELFLLPDLFNIDTKSPNVLQLLASIDTISAADVGVSTFALTAVFDEVMDTLISPTFSFPNENPLNTISLNTLASGWLNDTTFQVNYDVNTSSELVEDINVNVNGAVDHIGNPQELFQEPDLFNIDTKSPNITQLTASLDTIGLGDVGTATFILTAIFDEAMDILVSPTFTFPNENPLNTLTLNTTASSWLNDSTYKSIYDVNTSSELVTDIDVEVNDGFDHIGNSQVLYQASDLFNIDTKSPSIVSLTASVDSIGPATVGISSFVLTAVFDEKMNTLISPIFTYPNENPLNTIALNTVTSNWLNDSTFQAIYNVSNLSELITNIDVAVNGATDRTGNSQILFQASDLFNIDTKSPNVFQLSASVNTISQNDIGVSTFVLTAVFDEKMETITPPQFSFPNANPLNTITLNTMTSIWLNDSTYKATYDVTLTSELVTNIQVEVDAAIDRIGNAQVSYGYLSLFNIDTKSPTVLQLTTNIDTISLSDIGVSTLVLTAEYDKVMNTLISPAFTFPTENPLNTIALNTSASNWINSTTFQAIFDVNTSSELLENIDVEINGGKDSLGNPQTLFHEADLFNIDTKSPTVIQLSTSTTTISLSDVGVSSFIVTAVFDEEMNTLTSPAFTFPNENPLNTIALNTSASNWLNATTFEAIYDVANSSESIEDIDVNVSGASDKIGNSQFLFQEPDLFNIDTKSPSVIQLSASIDTISLSDVGISTFTLASVFDEIMDMQTAPTFSFPNENPSLTITLNISASSWLNNTTYVATYNVNNSYQLVENIDVAIQGAVDQNGNPQITFQEPDLFNVDTKSPNVVQLSANLDTISSVNIGVSTFVLTSVFDKVMDMLEVPTFTFPNEDPLNTIVLNIGASGWLNSTTYEAIYDVTNSSETLLNIDVMVDNAKDEIGNLQNTLTSSNLFNIITKQPELVTIIPSVDTISYSDTGVGTFFLALYFNEMMDTAGTPTITFPTENPMANTLVLNSSSSLWTNQTSYIAVFDVLPNIDTLFQIDVSVTSVIDVVGNNILANNFTDVFSINKREEAEGIQPELLTIIPSVDTISYSDTGVSTFFLALYFDNMMDTTSSPEINFPTENPLANTLVLNTSSSHWTNQNSYVAVYDVLPTVDTLYQIDVSITSVTDLGGNDVLDNNHSNVFSIDKKKEFVPTGNSQFFGISIYPNPILEDGNFSVAFEKNIQTVTATITDVRGKLIQTETYNDSQQLNLKLEGPPGVYILIIQSGDKKAGIKLVKK